MSLLTPPTATRTSITVTYNVTYLGGSTTGVTRGAYLSLSNDPRNGGNLIAPIQQGTQAGTGSYTITYTNLTPNRQYYIQRFVYNCSNTYSYAGTSPIRTLR